MIRIYPSMPIQGIDQDCIEEHSVSRGVSLCEWFEKNLNEFEIDREFHPLHVECNGIEITSGDWCNTFPSSNDPVDVYLKPQGGAILGFIVKAVVGALVASAVSRLLAPKPPKPQQGQAGGSIEQGRQIAGIGLQGNQAKLNEVVPEHAGRVKVFPDYINQPRHHFVDRRTRAIDFMYSFGRGEYDIPDVNLRIGSTPLSGFEGADFQIFNPGEDVTTHQASHIWYNAPEVGGTRGSSGIHLRSERDLPQTWVGELDFLGNDITPTDGSAPEGWGSGARLSIDLPIDFDVVTGPSGGYDTFIGYFQHLHVDVGDEINIRRGDGSLGRYRLAAWVAGGGGPSGAKDNMQLDVNLDGQWQRVINWGEGAHHKLMRRRDNSGNPPVYQIQSIGPDGTAIVDFRLDGSPVSGWAGFQGVLSNDHTVSLKEGSSGDVWTDIIQASKPGEVSKLIEWDIFFPEGLGKVEDDGSISSISRRVELQWREVGTSTWNSDTRSISGSTLDQIGFTYRVNLASAIRAEVRVRRVEVEDNDIQVHDRIEWFGLKTRYPRPSSYDGVTTLALTLSSRNTIATGAQDKLNAIIIRKFGGERTRSIVAWVRHVLRTIGYPNSDIDQEEMNRLGALWDARGDIFDFSHTSRETVHQVIRRAFAAGMAEPTNVDGLLTPVRDARQLEFEEMYTPQNMVSPLQRIVKMVQPDEIDGINVEYIDPNTWEPKTVECRLPGDQGFRVETIQAQGVNDRTRAWRLGMRERRRRKFVRWQYKFETELDALNSNYLSYVALATDLPGYGKSAIIEDVFDDNGVTVLVSSEPLDWSGTNHVVAWRRVDGKLIGPFDASRGRDDFHIRVENMTEIPVMSDKREPNHLLFGIPETWTFPALVRNITPKGFETVSVESENYDGRVYADDNNEAPA